MKSFPDRTSALRALIAYEQPVEPVLEKLAQYRWEVPHTLATLTSADLLGILDRYISGELSTAQVTDWADLIECRQDIGYSATQSEALSAAISRLANPNLKGE